jgi:hypothetical protein
MAPEMIRNDPYDEKSDVYSFGICCLLASTLVLRSDGEEIEAGGVRTGMQLAGEFGPVTVLSSHLDDHGTLPSTKKFWRITLADGSSFDVTDGHLLTLRVNKNPSVTRTHEGGQSIYVLARDPETLKPVEYGTRPYRVSSENPDASHDFAGLPTRDTYAEVRARMWAEWETERESDPNSLPARAWSKGDIVDVQVERLMDSFQLVGLSPSDAYFSAPYARRTEEAEGVVPIPVLGSAVSPGFKEALSRFRLVTYDADSDQYGYRPLRGPEHPEGADIVRVVMLMHNGLKVS